MNSTDVLEEICTACQGQGGRNNPETGWSDCYKCEGAGFIPTVLGERILNLMRHNSRALVSSAMHVSAAAS